MHILIKILLLFLLLAILYVCGRSLYPLEGLYYNFSKAKKVSNLERLEILYKLLDILLKYSKEFDITIWPVYGTLLGIVRDNELICYDEDVDMGIDSRDYRKMVRALKKISEENNEFTYVVLDIPFICKYARLFHRETGIHCDISIYYKNKAKYVRDIPLSEESNDQEVDMYLFPFTISHEGKDYNLHIPHNSNDLLTMWYGKDYMKPLYTCNNKCEDCK